MEIMLNPKKNININISTRRPKIGLDVPKSEKEQVNIDVGPPHSGIEYPIYHGPTTIKPEAYDIQILQTENKVVKENVFVLPIPYFVTSNPQGGNTVYIGE